jgi:hypothetical protein
LAHESEAQDPLFLQSNYGFKRARPAYTTRLREVHATSSVCYNAVHMARIEPIEPRSANR